MDDLSPRHIMHRIHEVSKDPIASDALLPILNYIQFIALDSLTDAKATITPYTVGSPPPPCPTCPPGKP